MDVEAGRGAPKRGRKRYKASELREVKRGRWTHRYDSDGRQVCGAALRGEAKGWACGASGRMLHPSGRCRMHGGAAGVGRPPKHGGRVYEHALGPQRSRFAELLARPDLLKTDPQVALYDTEVERLLEEAAEGRGPAWRGALDAACSELAETASTKPTDLSSLTAWASAVGHAAKLVADLLTRGLQSDSDTREALRLAAIRAELAVAERRTVAIEEATIPEKLVLASYARIAEILYRQLPERDARRIVDQIALGLVGARGADLLGAGAVQSPSGAPSLA